MVLKHNMNLEDFAKRGCKAWLISWIDKQLIICMINTITL